MKPATRSLVCGLALVVAFVAATAIGVVWQTNRTAQARSLHQLQLVGTVESELQANRLQELQLRAEALAHDSAFVDYVAQSMIPNPQLGGAVDSASISDLLKERRHGYDIAVVLDPHGKPVATSGILLREPASIQQDPLVTKAINTLSPVQGSWVDHGQLLWVAINPLLRGGVLQGVLLTATHVDDAFVIAVSRIASADITFVIQSSAAAVSAPSSGVDGWVSQALSAQLPAVLGLKNSQALSLTDAQHSATVWITPLDTVGGRAALVAVDPDADSGSGGAINAVAMPFLLGIAALGVFGVLIVLLLWRRTWLPLQQIQDLIEHASKGDRHLTLRINGSPIVRRLRDSVNHLLHPDQPSAR